MESIIIDGYNLMHKVSELKILLSQSREFVVEAMLKRLERHFFNSKINVILVLDGWGQNKSSRNVDAKFAKTDVGHNYETADAMIKAMVEKARNKKLLKVISSDREVTWFAKDCGCKIQTSESFWGELKDKHIKEMESIRESKEKPEIVTKSEFDFLMKEFTKK